MERPAIPGYQVGGPIGFGAGGAALAVRDRAGNAFAAVVIPRNERLERLVQLRHVRHPHLPVIHDLVAVDDSVAVIMGLVIGPSLATLVNAREWLSPAEVATVWRGTADALAAMHRRGLVHGDVSPANILIGSGGDPVLVDIVGHGGAERGHRGYIPPELDDGPATTASDVWSLARTLTWASGEDHQVMRHVGAALATDPAARPSAQDFATWAFLLGTGVSVTVPAAANLAGAQLRSAVAPTVVAGSPPRAHRPWSFLLAVVVAAVLLSARMLAADAVAARAVGMPEPPPEQEVGAVVESLLIKRDTALVAGDREALAEVYLPDSRVAEVDHALAEGLADSGVRLEGYGTDLIAVEAMTIRSRSFVARVELAQRSHSRVDADGVRRAVERQGPHCREVTAVKRGEWRIADVEVCP